MYCKNCGAHVEDGALFCSECGQKQQEAQQYRPQVVENQYQQPAYNGRAVAVPGSPNSLVFGILSMAFSWIPILSIVGIVMGALAIGKSKTFRRMNGGLLFGASKVGFIFGIIGLISSIIGTVYWIIYLLVVCVFVASYSGSYHTYYSSL